jgi:hypothetical protein
MGAFYFYQQPASIGVSTPFCDSGKVPKSSLACVMLGIVFRGNVKQAARLPDNSDDILFDYRPHRSAPS